MLPFIYQFLNTGDYNSAENGRNKEMQQEISGNGFVIKLR